MAIVIGNGAFRIWTGRRESRGRRTSNVAVLIQESRLPQGVTLEDVERSLQDRIKAVVTELFPWCSQ